MRLTSPWSLAVFAIGLVLVAVAVNQGYAAAAPTQQAVNESITVNYSAPPVAVDAPDDTLSYEPGATVYNASGVELANTTDYRWWPVNGTVQWHNTSNTTDGATASITYNYTAPDESGRATRETMSIFGQVGGLAVLVAGIATALRYGLGGDW